MAITYGKIEGLITIGSSWTLEIVDSGGTATATLTADDYYWSSNAGEGNDFAARLQADLRAAGAGDSWTVSIDASENGTGLVTIDDPSHNSWAINWSNTTQGPTVQELCGFATDLTSKSTAQTGTRHARSLWLPDAPISSLYGADDAGTEETDARVVTSAAGHVSAVYSQRRLVNRIWWEGISRAKCRIQGESTAGESYQQFFRDVWLAEGDWTDKPGGPIRVHWDAADDATYVEYKAGGDVLRKFEPEQLVDGWIEQWRIVIPRLVKVPS